MGDMFQQHFTRSTFHILCRVVSCTVFSILASYATIYCVDNIRNSMSALDEIYAGQPYQNEPARHPVHFSRSVYPRWRENVIVVGELLPITGNSYQNQISNIKRNKRFYISGPRSYETRRPEPSTEREKRASNICNVPGDCDKNSGQLQKMLQEVQRQKILEQDKYVLLYRRIKTLQNMIENVHGKQETVPDSAKLFAAIRLNRKSLNITNNSPPIYISVDGNTGNVMDTRIQHVSHQTDPSIQANTQKIQSDPDSLHSNSFLDNDFNPERLFSGYDLSGGDTPGRHLDEKRKEHIIRTLRRHHEAGILSSEGEIILKKQASQERLGILQRRLLKQVPTASDAVDPQSPDITSPHKSGGETLQHPSLSRTRDYDHQRSSAHHDGTRAKRGFLAALKMSQASPYKAAMTGTVFEHFMKLRRAAAAKRP
jgi:hypothetical protein